jgi:hypothetical protein
MKMVEFDTFNKECHSEITLLKLCWFLNYRCNYVDKLYISNFKINIREKRRDNPEKLATLTTQDTRRRQNTQDEDKTHNTIGIGHQTSSNYKHARFECGRSWVRTHCLVKSKNIKLVWCSFSAKHAALRTVVAVR